MKRILAFNIWIKDVIDSKYWAIDKELREKFNSIFPYLFKFALTNEQIDKIKNMGILDDLGWIKETSPKSIASNLPIGAKDLDAILEFYVKNSKYLEPLEFNFHAKYTTSELLKYKLLEINFADNDEWDLPWEPFFNYIQCDKCKSILKIEQKQALILKKQKYPKDLYEISWSHEARLSNPMTMIASSKAKQLLENIYSKDIEFAPVIDKFTKKPSERMHQIIFKNEYNFLDIVEYPRIENFRCSSCKKDIEVRSNLRKIAQDIIGEIKLKKNIYRGENIFIIYERTYGWMEEKDESTRSSNIWKAIVFSNSVFALLIKNKISGLKARPIHLI